MLDILIVDDEPRFQECVAEVLRDAGHRVAVASDGASALGLVTSHVYDVVITDIRLPQLDGLSLFRRIRQEAPSTDVILMTGFGAVAEAVAALKEGAGDYLTKPIDLEEISLRVQRTDERRRVKRELQQARDGLMGGEMGPIVFGGSPTMTRLYYLIETFSQSDAPLLVHGDSGTGKEVVARRVHELSSRSGRPFVPVNCAAFPDTLLEAELFGHERGAFTGAVRKRDGRFKSADRGTVFLDEVAELSPSAQAKLLRVLQEGTFEPLGTNDPVTVDVRIISATHQNLKELIAQGRFREDLFYRLKVLTIELAPLRERRGDLPLLVQHFLRRFDNAGNPPLSIAPRAWAALTEYAFPGNVRELEHALQHAAIMAVSRASPEIDIEDLPPEFAGSDYGTSAQGEQFRPLRAAIGDFEREYLGRALEMVKGKKAKAAQLLGVSRKALWKKLTVLGLQHTGPGTKEPGDAAEAAGPSQQESAGNESGNPGTEADQRARVSE
jgi:two-component system response regulator HydG/two-component system response regulator AtoC